jgi:hypothetical protein
VIALCVGNTFDFQGLGKGHKLFQGVTYVPPHPIPMARSG